MKERKISVFFVCTILLLILVFGQLITPATPVVTPKENEEKKDNNKTSTNEIAKNDAMEEETFLCRDAVKPYYCNSIDQCGRSSCIPPNTIRCDDNDGSTYDCRVGQTCGKGRCVAEGKKMCTILPRSRECINTHSCCKGTNVTNSQISCISGSCPSGTIQVMEYQHPHYQYFGDAQAPGREI